MGYRYKLGRKLVSNETYEEENSCFNPEPVPEQVFVVSNGSLPLRKCFIAKSLFNTLEGNNLPTSIFFAAFDQWTIKCFSL